MEIERNNNSDIFPSLEVAALAWLPTKPRAKEIEISVHAFIVDATKIGGDSVCAASPSPYLKSLNRSFST